MLSPLGLFVESHVYVIFFFFYFSTPTKVILVPSSKDVCSPMVYPTPPYDVAGNFTCVSDPALLNIEGTVLALTATDILFHLGKEEISS